LTAIPDRFRAYAVDRPDGSFERGIREAGPDGLPPGAVEIRVEWSSVNFKDSLAASEDGKVARKYPLILGIDLAGEVIAWVVPLPRALTTREAMAIGTAGFTAAMAVSALEERGLEPATGPVLVTGATGGVGSTAISILAELGYEVWAATGKDDERAWLSTLGAVGFLTRDECSAEGKPLESERWAAAVDSVGAATLPYILRTLKRGGAAAACGNASGPALTTTVFPFILRGAALLGMDSAYLPIAQRRRLWSRLATDLRPRALAERVTEIPLEDVETALDAIRQGEARGRWVVRVGAPEV